MNKLERRLEGIKKARKVLRVWRGCFGKKEDYYMDGGEAEKRLIKTRVPCSCLWCGNPRKHFGQVTRQEKKVTEMDTE